MSYQGWTNYETWAVNLWIDNDQGLYELANDHAQEAWDDTDAEEPNDQRMTEATRCLADSLKETVESLAPEVQGLWADLLNAALSEVDWDEIAANKLSDLNEETPS